MNSVIIMIIKYGSVNLCACVYVCACVCVCVCVSKGVARGPTVVTGSFVCGCGRIFNRSGDLTRYHKYCSSQPPLPKQKEFYCGCGRMIHRKSDLT